MALLHTALPSSASPSASHRPSHTSSVSKPCLARAPKRISALPEAGLVSAATGAAALSIPPTALLVGVAGAALLGAVAYSMQQQGSTREANGPSAQEAEVAAATPKKENAVLVFGASGRVGRRVVKQLLQAGRTVVATGRTAEVVQQVLTQDAGLAAGVQPDGSGVLVFEGVDVRSKDSLRRPELWEGVTQVLFVLAGKAGMRPDGQFGYFDGLTPEDIEAKGIVNALEVLPEFLTKSGEVQVAGVVSGLGETQPSTWVRMDDVIMGGQSSSLFAAAPEQGPEVERWKGELIVEGGGFAGAKLAHSCDLSAYDGLALRVKGDGSTFKINIKTSDQMTMPEYTYQATFDTVAGQWADVFLPWHNFVAVKKAYSLPKAAPLDPSKIAQFALVYSRFEFNGAPNAAYKPGSFELLLDGGIKAFKAPRPQLVQLSSAGVERNAVIGDDAEARKLDVPIVQLNPGGVLNHKYYAEAAIRASGWPYAIVRSTGMVDTNENGPFKLEANQGDAMSGSIGRDDVADVLCAVLHHPEATNKTFEVRRSEALDGRGKAMTPADYTRMMLRLTPDRQRTRVGLQPFPRYVPPPAATVTEERKQEIVKNIEEVRSQFKAKGMGVQENRPAAPQQQAEDSKATEKQKEVVGAGARR